jgi:hypothetical protein
MRAADLLTLITNSPTKREYKGIYLNKEEQIVPLTSIQTNQMNQCVLTFEERKSVLSLNELLLFLMKNREKDIVYQKDHQTYPLYGLKEDSGKLII